MHGNGGAADFGRRWLLISAGAVAAAVAVYVLAVLTRTGQELENAALRGADEANATDVSTATDTLDRITVYSLAVATGLVALIGALRRRTDLVVAGVGVIVAGQVVTQVLKRLVLVRPRLVSVTGPYEANSLPSGHTTIAMTVLFAALIVVPYRWRGVTVIIGLTWASAIGAYTLTAKWHRLSDTLAADAIALALASAASWWLARRGVVVRTGERRRIIRTVFVVLTVLSVVLLLAIAAILWGVTITRVGFAEAVHQETWNIYLGATSLATAGSLITALVFLASWHRLDTTTTQTAATLRQATTSTGS